MTDLNEWISERRRLHDAATEGPWGLSSAERDALYTLPAALTAIEKVLELHQPVESSGGDYLCSTCAERDNCTVAMDWPCPTVRAIEGAINE